jgi:TRAP-type transport system periplasmic protein
VKNGLADISFSVHGYTPGRYTHTQMVEFPFMGNFAEPLSVAFQKVASKNPQFEAEHAGMKVISFFTPGHGVQHQAPHQQSGRSERPQIPHWRRHGQ